MKRYVIALVSFLAVQISGYAQTGISLMSLDQAIADVTGAVEVKVQRGFEIAITKIDASLPELADFLYDQLSNRFASNGKLILFERGKTRQNVNQGHQYQVSGLITDESAVGIGHYLGAKVIVTGTFSRYANFSQLSIRALDVRTTAVLATSHSRIPSNDPILVGVTQPVEKANLPVVTEDALAINNALSDRKRCSVCM